MDSLLRSGVTTRHHADVVDFGKRMKDGYKVSYISNSRVTEADADNWMVLPLIEENETEASCERRNFLLLHVPSLREFLHKFDRLPQPAEDHKQIKLEDPDIDTISVLETSVMTPISSVITTDFDDDIVEGRANEDMNPSKKMEERFASESPYTSADSSYFESAERRGDSPIDNGDRTGCLFSHSIDPRKTVTRTSEHSFLSPPICTFKIEPASPIDFSSLTHPTGAVIGKTAAATAYIPTIGETNHSGTLDLPPTRKIHAGVVKKQMSAQSPCPRCYVMLDNLDEAKAHIERATCVQIGMHACEVCAKRLASKWTLKKHVERHAEKPRCVFCSNHFKSVDELLEHNLLSGHMYRPEEAGAGAPEINELRKLRRQEQKDAMRNKEATHNLSTVVAAFEDVNAVVPAASEEQPIAKIRKMTPIDDEAVNAVASLMELDDQAIDEK